MTHAGPPWIDIGPRVFVRRYRFLDQTIGAVVGDEAVLLVDTRSTAAQARELLADLRRLTALPLVVVDTHHHFDHAWGNAALRHEAMSIWGHALVPARLRESEAGARLSVPRRWPEIAAELSETVVEPPDRLVEGTAAIDLGGVTVELRHLGRGHTDNDLVARVAGDAAIVFAGDLVEEGAPPSFDDAHVLDWPATLGRLLDLVDGPVVPGHGRPVDRDFVAGQLADINVVAERARRTWPELAAGGHDPTGPPPPGLTEDVAATLGWPHEVVDLALFRALLQAAGRA